MKVILDITKSVHDNAARYYEEAKEAKKKIQGLERAIEDTKKEIEKAKKKEEEKKRKAVKIKREKQWFEKFHWFYTSKGKLVIGGKDAKNNDLIFAKYMDSTDLFFHADIQGGSVVVLKDWKTATEEEKKEAAQFAASFSNAWKNGNASVDVYCVKKDQLSKHATSGFVPTGGFAIKGEREWFRSTKLGLVIGIGEKGLEIIPECSTRKLANGISLYQSNAGKEKGEIVKILSKRLNVHPDDLLQILPAGRMKLK